MNVLVLGGMGFVGRHFTKRYAQLGHEVIIVDDLSSGIHPLEWSSNVRLTDDEYARLGIRERDVRDWFKTANAEVFDLIIHCAAVVGGRMTIDFAPLAVAADLAIDADFFNWCVAGSMPRQVVYFSSSAVYPVELQHGVAQVDGTAPPFLSEGLVSFKNVSRIGMPDMTYGWAKLSGEYLMHHAVKTYGLNCVAYRPFSGYGEDQSLDYPFPAIVKRFVDREDPITIWGSGGQVRDFIHIDDIVDAVMATYSALDPGAVLNLGRGEPVSFRELVARAAKMLTHPVQVFTDESKPTGVAYRVADTHQLAKWFQPKITLEQGIRRVYDHLLKGS